jgi:hypothetical protein
MNFGGDRASNRIVKTETLKLEGGWIEALLEGQRVGHEVVIRYRTMVLYEFDRRDPVLRDVAIASMLRAGICGKTVARLTTMSAAHVCEVQQRVDLGGIEALLTRPRRGRFSGVTAAQREAIRVRRTQGASIPTIAKELGLSRSVLGRVVLAVPAAMTQEQGEWWKLSSNTAEDDFQERSEAPTAFGGVPEQAQEAVREPIEASPPEATALERERQETDEELEPGAALPSGPAEHPCRYAGTLLLCAAAWAIGLFKALQTSKIERPSEAVYPAHQVATALISAWGSGFASLESMHERDARALGVVLGLERSPSVRTLHRAMAQMIDGFDPIALQTGLLRGVVAATERARLLFGVDGHFKPYSGKAPIDKGYDTKRRLAVRGLADVRINDEYGWTWSVVPVGTGDALSEHLSAAVHTLRVGLGRERPIVLASDRGGFAFEILNELARDQTYYIAYVPATVSMDNLSSIAPAQDGAGETLWTHQKLRHPTRLIVKRDGVSMIPMVSNLPTLVPTSEVVQMLCDARGWQENSIRAARSFVQIDRLNDRGSVTFASDDRLVTNPVRTAVEQRHAEAQDKVDGLARQRPVRGQRTLAQIEAEEFFAQLHENVLAEQVRKTPAKVPRNTLEPEALRAWLKTRNRALLNPLKHATDNARRWLLAALGAALAPSDQPEDASAVTRTLLALVRTEGTVRFEHDQVVVTLDLPLPPTPYRRLADGLEALDAHRLRFTDGERRVVFRLSPRPLRSMLPSAQLTVSRPSSS